MQELKKLILKPGKERSVLNFHPWLFSGAFKESKQRPEDGELIEVFSSNHEYLATGFYNYGSITVRIISFERTEINEEFWQKKFHDAYQLRKACGLTENAETNIFRLIHGEGDGIPGLIVDVYGSVAVLQSYNFGIYKHRQEFAKALLSLPGKKISSIYDKSAETMPGIQGAKFENAFLYGDEKEIIATENNNQFHIDWINGQKTGFFIDQRENRKLVGRYSEGKKVLNTFCYSGGFSIYALQAGASEVHSVDSSAKAMALTERNMQLNGYENRHQSFTSDVFSYLKEIDNTYDVIILDPPAFAKHLNAVNQAARAYQGINRTAFSKIKPGGIVFTFSCSQVIDKTLFRKIVFAAAAESGRNVKILHQLTQGNDHPISIYHPEGEYLKGLVLFVE